MEEAGPRRHVRDVSALGRSGPRAVAGQREPGPAALFYGGAFVERFATTPVLHASVAHESRNTLSAGLNITRRKFGANPWHAMRARDIR